MRRRAGFTPKNPQERGSAAVSVSSRCSQARANAHSRSAVRVDMPRACAASATGRPAKWRSSTSFAACGSTAANRVRAASRATRSSRGSGAAGFAASRSMRVPVPAVLFPPLAAGGLDEDAAHGLGGGGEEVAAMVPLVAVGRANQPEVRFVDEGGRLKRVAGRFGGQPGGGEAAQFVVDQRQQLSSGVGVAPVHRAQQLRDFVQRFPRQERPPKRGHSMPEQRKVLGSRDRGAAAEHRRGGDGHPGEAAHRRRGRYLSKAANPACSK